MNVKQNRPTRERTKRSVGRLATLLLALLTILALAACGGDGSKDAAGNSAQSTSSQAVDHAAHEQATPAEARDAAADADDATAHAEHSAAEHADHTAADDAEAHADHAADDHAHHEELSAAELPGTSIYHLASAFTDHHGEPMALPELRGAPSVFVMFYGDCTTACPLLVRSAEEIEAALPQELREDTQFVMVSFDTKRDTPQNLLAYAQDKGLDKDNWHWLVGTPLQTRQLATLLGVQYRDAGNGVFAHSNLVTVVDPDGVPSARLEGISVELEPAIDAILAAGTVSN